MCGLHLQFKTRGCCASCYFIIQLYKQKVVDKKENKIRMSAVVSLSTAATQCRVQHRQCLPIRHSAPSSSHGYIHRKDKQMDVYRMAQSGQRRTSAAFSVRAGDEDTQAPKEEEEKNDTVDETVSTATENSNTTEDVSQDSTVLSTEEIQRQMGALRAAAASSQDDASKDESLVQGVLEEVRLIEWPSFTSALLNTLLVIALVLGTSVVLFGVNTSLSEISRQIYPSSSSL